MDYIILLLRKIKQYFPDAGELLSQKLATVTTTYTGSTAPYTHTDATGVRELTWTVEGTIVAGTGLIVCFGAPSGGAGDAVAGAWLADTTIGADGLQYIYIPAGSSKTRTFDPPITRWDMKALGGNVTVWQEKAR